MEYGDDTGGELIWRRFPAWLEFYWQVGQCLPRLIDDAYVLSIALSVPSRRYVATAVALGFGTAHAASLAGPVDYVGQRVLVICGGNPDNQGRYQFSMDTGDCELSSDNTHYIVRCDNGLIYQVFRDTAGRPRLPMVLAAGGRPPQRLPMERAFIESIIPVGSANFFNDNSLYSIVAGPVGANSRDASSLVFRSNDFQAGVPPKGTAQDLLHWTDTDYQYAHSRLITPARVTDETENEIRGGRRVPLVVIDGCYPGLMDIRAGAVVHVFDRSDQDYDDAVRAWRQGFFSRDGDMDQFLADPLAQPAGIEFAAYFKSARGG